MAVWHKISDSVSLNDKGDTFIRHSKTFGMSTSGKSVHKVGSLVFSDMDD